MSDRDEISHTLGRFMNSLDLKDWGLMTDLLEPRIYVNYSSLRGDPPQDLDATEYVRLRSEAPEGLATQHLLANIDVVADGDSASARASCMIWRWTGTAYFHSHAFYEFSLRRRGTAWRIGAIQQRILWSEGDPRIHKRVGRGRA